MRSALRWTDSNDSALPKSHAVVKPWCQTLQSEWCRIGFVTNDGSWIRKAQNAHGCTRPWSVLKNAPYDYNYEHISGEAQLRRGKCGSLAEEDAGRVDPDGDHVRRFERADECAVENFGHVVAGGAFQSEVVQSDRHSLRHGIAQVDHGKCTAAFGQHRTSPELDCSRLISSTSTERQLGFSTKQTDEKISSNSFLPFSANDSNPVAKCGLINEDLSHCRKRSWTVFSYYRKIIPIQLQNMV